MVNPDEEGGPDDLDDKALAKVRVLVWAGRLEGAAAARGLRGQGCYDGIFS